MAAPSPISTTDLLAEAGRALAAAHGTLLERLEAVAALVAPVHAAWCGIAVRRPDGALQWARSGPAPAADLEAVTGEWLAQAPADDPALLRIPLTARGQPVGALVLVEPADADAAGDLANLCALAIDQATLAATAERTAMAASALAAAEEAERRAAFVNEVGTLLDGSLDYETALRRLAQAAVPMLADWCFVDVADASGGYRRAAVAHVDVGCQQLGWELAERFPPDDSSRGGAGWTLRENRPMLVTDLGADDLATITRSPAEADALRRLGLCSLMTLPLRARGRVLGCVTLAAADGDRRYTEVDLAHAMDVVTRAGLAIDNARLFTELARSTRASEFLAEASKALFAVLDDRRSYETLVSLVVPELADWAVVDVPSPGGGRLDAVAIAARDPARHQALEQLRARYPVEPGSELVARVLRTGEPQLFAAGGDEQALAAAGDGEHLELLRALGGHTAVVVALVARGRTLATLTAGRTQSADEYDVEHVRLLEEVARRAAIAADNARLYQERAYIARTLQQSLLPPHVPTVPGLQIAARFRPAGEGFDVGGDFYDLFPSGPATWTVTIGDVCGKGPDAAALTALARYTLRAAALTERSPQRILALLNDAILDQQRSSSDFCSVALARFELAPGHARVVLSSGGHPPAIVLREDGHVEPVAATGSLLGVVAGAPLSETEIELGPGDTFVLYTDGVVEARRAGEQWGEAALRDLLARAAGLEVATIADRIERTVVEWQQGHPRDDIALLLLRVAYPGTA